MSSDKKKPTSIDASFVAKASGKLEETVAEELQAEDPTIEEAEAVIEELTVEEPVIEEIVAEEEEEEAKAEATPEQAPIRHRGPK
tara:strand:+ start:1487 stop:1741 length:255 start_codon:yes stop_codon:yes gene_type:complete